MVGASKISQFYQVLPVEGAFWLPDALHAILYGPCQCGIDSHFLETLSPSAGYLPKEENLWECG